MQAQGEEQFQRISYSHQWNSHSSAHICNTACSFKFENVESFVRTFISETLSGFTYCNSVSFCTHKADKFTKSHILYIILLCSKGKRKWRRCNFSHPIFRKSNVRREVARLPPASTEAGGCKLKFSFAGFDETLKPPVVKKHRFHF